MQRMRRRSSGRCAAGRVGSRLPPPVQAEAPAMPSDDRGWRHDQQGVLPAAHHRDSQAQNSRSTAAGGVAEPTAAGPPLLAQGQVFGRQRAAAQEEAAKPEAYMRMTFIRALSSLPVPPATATGAAPPKCRTAQQVQMPQAYSSADFSEQGVSSKRLLRLRQRGLAGLSPEHALREFILHGRTDHVDESQQCAGRRNAGGEGLPRSAHEGSLSAAFQLFRPPKPRHP